MNTTDRRLDNGIRILTGQRLESGSVVVAINVSAGSIDEGSKRHWGAAHFLEHMAFKGTKDRDRLAIVREVEGRGGTINACTSHDATLYYIVTTPRHFTHAAEVLHDIVFNSIFPQDEFDKEKRVVLEEIKQMNDSPFSVLWKRFDAEMFAGGGRAHPVAGTEKSIGEMSRQDLIEFKNGHYTNDVITVGAVGNIEQAGIDFLEELFLMAPKTEPSVIGPQRATLSATMSQLAIPSKFDQCYLFVGFEGLNDREMFATPEARIATTLIGEGMSSLLFQRVREKLGIAYQVGAFLDSNLHNGTFVCYAVTNPDNVLAAKNEILKTLSDVQRALFDACELKEAKERIIGPMYTGSETNFAMACKLLYSSIATGEFIDLSEREKRYRSVSPYAVAEFIKELSTLDKARLEVCLIPKQ